MNRTIIVLSLVLALAVSAAAETRELPPPEKTGGMPLMEALSLRRSTREFRKEPLSDQMLSSLLWAACGINRPESGLRTAPTAVNWQEIDVYVALADGLFLYDHKAHALQPVLEEDIRPFTGKQDFMAAAPVVLIYVADQSRMGQAVDTKDFYSATDTGFVSQNVYLFCAANNLATVVVGWVDKEALAEKMGLGDEQKVILVQPVGGHTD